MNKVVAALLLTGAFASGSTTRAQSPGVPSEVQKHLDAARVAAGVEHAGLYETLRADVLGLLNPAPRGGGPGPGAAAPPPAPGTWHAEPVKVFDNLYFVGMTEYSAWAITTSQGIILLDAIYDYSVQDEVEGGLKKLGLNPADLKYVVVSHGHTDHAGGAKYLQEKYGAKVLMSAADYDLLDQQNPSWKPKRDLVITDGQRLTLGDTTLTFYLTPGHTLGTVSTIFPVRDGRDSHVVAAWGGTRFNFGPIRQRLDAYQTSAQRFRGVAAMANADVILSNHTVYDGSKTKLPAMKARKPGEQHPYVVGKDVVRRYLVVADESAQAALAGVTGVRP